MQATITRPEVDDVRDTCDIRGIVGGRWSMPVICGLGAEPVRYSQLRARVTGISQRMLTVTLRQLQRDGLISRTVYAEVPLRVEYAHTPLGASLARAALPLLTWGVEHRQAITENRHAFDAAH